ncbi:amidohydrolase family protein [Novosphingobium sp. 9]|uniref:amidohydrolase family protein n=1 Tax=Novosphingobium sp. 9 TaxID=2025349 RepID=UPI0021B60AAA|nr:amidohydrolase family protein [Novosphingobium sp. 9]
MKFLSALAVASVLAASPAVAAPIALVGARIIDGNGGTPIENGTILIDGSRIVAVGTNVAIPKGAQRIDEHGRTIIPGLITDHSHIGQYQGVTEGPAAYTRASIVAQLAQYRKYGVLTVVALGDNRPLFDTLRADAHAGLLPTDLYGVDQGIGVPNGALPQAVFHSAPDQLFRPTTPEEAREAVRKMVAEHTDLVKIWVDNFGGSLPAKMSPEIYRAVIDESHRLGVRVAAHIHDLDDAQGVIDAGVDILAHGVRDQPVPPAFVAELKAKGIWYIPTLSLDEATVAWAKQEPWTLTPMARAGLSPELAHEIDDPAWRAKTLASPQAPAAEASLAMNLRNLATLYKAGVKIGFGTDSGAVPLRVPGVEEHRELVLLVQAGLTPLQAITIATRDAAALMELPDRGTIAPGKRADLVVLSADPTHNIRAVGNIAETWSHGER